MKKVIITVLVVVLLTSGLLVGCEGVTVTGSGNLKTKTFDFSDFTGIKAESGFRVELTKSSTFSIEITADDNVLEDIKVDKSGDTLQIRPQRNRIYRSVTFIAKITMPDLYKIDLSGGSRVSITGFSSSHDLSVGLSGGSNVAGDITAGNTDFDLSGGSQVALSGSADDLDINGSGGSQLELEAFSVNNADVNLSGGGRATVNVNGTLDVNLSGGSRVIYIGKTTMGDIDLSGDSTISEDEKATPTPTLAPTPAPTPTPAGNVYEDPEGRFSMTLVGDWTPVETDGTYATYAYADMDLAMSLVSIEASDAEGDLPAAVQSIGIDPASLTETYRGNWNRWSIFYYNTSAGEGVTVLGQVQDGIGYYIVATGDAAITANPPEDVMKTIGGFALAGEIVLPSTVPEFESYVNDIVGLRPPALSIATATTDDVIYAQGFGMADRPEGTQAASDTVYFWGSITKTMTATAIMQLREQGLVDLDAQVSDHLDYFPAQYGITVRNLLTHSSGLPEPDDWLPKHLRLEGQPLPDADAMDREYYAELTGLMFEPGTQSAYANPDFVTLGQIVAVVTGQSYVEYVREHILVPLGMDTTDFEYSTETILANAAAPATSLANREAMISILDEARGLDDAASFFRETDEDTAWMNHFIVGEAAGGGLMGPPTEMVRYAQMLLNGGELDGVRILSFESVELLKQEQVSTSGEPLGFGMAWLIRDDPEHPYIEHGGGGEGVDALLRVYSQDGFAIALQANSGGYSRQDVMNAAANVVITMLGG